MDPANLTGIVCDDPLAVDAPDELSVEMRWNIESFLPYAIQQDFRKVVRFFLVEFFRVRQKSNAGTRAPLRVIQNGAPDATQRDAGKIKEQEDAERSGRYLDLRTRYSRPRDYCILKVLFQTNDKVSGFGLSFPILLTITIIDDVDTGPHTIRLPKRLAT